MSTVISSTPLISLDAVSLDTETMGLYPWYKGKDIVSIGFTLEAGRADCLYLGPFPDPVATIEPELFAQIEWLLTTPRVRLRGSNLKYDLVWIAEKAAPSSADGRHGRGAGRCRPLCHHRAARAPAYGTARGGRTLKQDR